MMDAGQAVRIMYAEEVKASADGAALVAEKEKEYASLQGSVEAAAKRGYVDTIIEPADTRSDR